MYPAEAGLYLCARARTLLCRLPVARRLHHDARLARASSGLDGTRWRRTLHRRCGPLHPHGLVVNVVVNDDHRARRAGPGVKTAFNASVFAAAAAAFLLAGARPDRWSVDGRRIIS